MQSAPTWSQVRHLPSSLEAITSCPLYDEVYQHRTSMKAYEHHCYLYITANDHNCCLSKIQQYVTNKIITCWRWCRKPFSFSWTQWYALLTSTGAVNNDTIEHMHCAASRFQITSTTPVWITECFQNILLIFLQWRQFVIPWMCNPCMFFSFSNQTDHWNVDSLSNDPKPSKHLLWGFSTTC